MASHRTVKRRYVDLLLVASAVCPHGSAVASLSIG
jgi:hypothetical protein